jgi:thioredoxin-like negative regulator of GroEL
MTIEQLNEQIKSNDALLVYFSGTTCGVCKVLKPKITKAFNENYPKIKQIEINIDENIQLARQFNIYSMPSILVYFDGKEFARKERNISVDGFISEISRPYGLFFE